MNFAPDAPADRSPGAIRLIEPFGLGGGPDVVARTIAGPLSKRWGRPVEVENRPGGGSTAAPALVAKALADGATLLVSTSAHAYSAAVTRGLPYDPLGDFVAVTPLTAQAYVLVVGRAVGISSLSELISAAKGRPGAMTFGSTGEGTGTHIGTEELNLMAGIKAAHVPAGPGDSIAEVVAGVASGAIDYVMLPISMATTGIAAGTLTALGVTTAKRSPALPGVPAISEVGVAGYDFPIWYGVWAPADTPNMVVERLARDITAAVSEPVVHDWLVNHGMSPLRMTPRDFTDFVRVEKLRAERIIQAVGLT